MKKMVHKYRISKFKSFTNGLLFAIITLIALGLCIADITKQAPMNSTIILPFGVAVLSMVMGIITMLRNTNDKYKVHKVN